MSGARGTPVRAAPAARLGPLALVAALAGCAGFAPDSGFDAVRQTVREHVAAEVAWSRDDTGRAALAARVDELLARPLGMDEAVQVALLNHRGLQAAFGDLAIADADRVQAGRLPNPGFSFARLSRGDEVELERSLHLNLARLLVMPLASQAQQRRFEATQRAVAQEALTHAAETRRAWIEAVAARESLRYRRQVLEAAGTAAELGRRMVQAGNWSALQQAREQGFYAEAQLGLARAVQAEDAARERLVRRLGLWGGQLAFTLPQRLPDLPAAPRELPDVERKAIAQRLDVQAARLGTEQLARNLGLARATRFVNVLELGLVHASSNEAPVQRGWEISLELPLFDGGGARLAKSEALYRQALERTAQIAIDARSEVRQAYRHYRASWDVARHWRDEVVPVRRRIADENLLRYNGMLIGVFELLADARAQVASVEGYLEALREFWFARTALDAALVGPARLAEMPGKVATEAAVPAAPDH